MKDAEARKRLDKIEAEFKEQVNCGLRDVVLGNCPKCKHETLNHREDVVYQDFPHLFLRYTTGTLAPIYEYTCLTCGGKWKVEKTTKSVNKIIKKRRVK